ncbi:hypothetical protein [Sinomicrobium soli]|uniref:hypothetical protein n=1 Tax=Sinomicrobium sp. N-1-3-6 TaxID=2219864 RepID=UPI000DCEF797|nr:hypothetical protein [Sinomicrobium sp. N-1-3-6]RAV30199.1 hypothetical protein DN748_05245 [Sinomicrobium sp. N-1-3-6]
MMITVEKREFSYKMGLVSNYLAIISGVLGLGLIGYSLFNRMEDIRIKYLVIDLLFPLTNGIFILAGLLLLWYTCRSFMTIKVNNMHGGIIVLDNEGITFNHVKGTGGMRTTRSYTTISMISLQRQPKYRAGIQDGAVLEVAFTDGLKARFDMEYFSSEEEFQTFVAILEEKSPDKVFAG